MIFAAPTFVILAHFAVLRPRVVDAKEQGSASYIRWGRKTCENAAVVVYKGESTASTFLHVRFIQL